MVKGKPDNKLTIIGLAKHHKGTLYMHKIAGYVGSKLLRSQLSVQANSKYERNPLTKKFQNPRNETRWTYERKNYNTQSSNPSKSLSLHGNKGHTKKTLTGDSTLSSETISPIQKTKSWNLWCEFQITSTQRVKFEKQQPNARREK